MPRKLNCITWIMPTPETLIDLVGLKEIKYSELLKILWKHWKANKLYRVEKLSKKS